MHGRNICTELLDNGASTPQFWKEELETEAIFSSFLFQEDAVEEARRHSVAQRTEAQSDRNVGAVRNFIHCFLSFRSPIAGKTNKASELGPPSNPITSREPRTQRASKEETYFPPPSSLPPNKHDARKDDNRKRGRPEPIGSKERTALITLRVNFAASLPLSQFVSSDEDGRREIRQKARDSSKARFSLVIGRIFTEVYR